MCGTDGVTYPNSCELEVDNCNNDKTVEIQSEGHCPEGDKEEEVVTTVGPDAEAKDCIFRCEQIYNPVCGSDGFSYNNQCLLGKILTFITTINV